MKFPVAAALLDACVLGVISNMPTYGYDLTQKIGTIIEVSESTLYPVLRRLLKDGMLESYDESYDGRNRRYYKITDRGKQILQSNIKDWQTHRQNIEKLLTGGETVEQS